MSVCYREVFSPCLRLSRSSNCSYFLKIAGPLEAWFPILRLFLVFPLALLRLFCLSVVFLFPFPRASFVVGNVSPRYDVVKNAFLPCTRELGKSSVSSFKGLSSSSSPVYESREVLGDSVSQTRSISFSSSFLFLCFL